MHNEVSQIMICDGYLKIKGMCTFVGMLEFHFLTGAMTLICDMNEYKKVMKEFKVGRLHCCVLLEK